MDTENAQDCLLGAFQSTLVNQQHNNQEPGISENQENDNNVANYTSPCAEYSAQDNQLFQGTENCLNLKFPPNVLLTCCQLKTGEAMHVPGLAKKLEGGSEAIKMDIRRHADVICFSLQGLDSLSDIWQCSFMQLQDGVDDSSVTLMRPKRKQKEMHWQTKEKWKRTFVIKQQMKSRYAAENDESCSAMSDADHDKTSETDDSDYRAATSVDSMTDDKIPAHDNARAEDLVSVPSGLERKRLAEIDPSEFKDKLKGCRLKRKRTSFHSKGELYALNKAAMLDQKGKQMDSDLKQECLLCGEVFTQEHYLPRHIKRCHSISVAEYMELLRSSPDEQQEKIVAFWQMAQIGCELSKQRSNSCQFCGEAHAGTLALRHHLKVKHYGETDISNKDENCPAVISQGRDGSHEKSTYPCRYCGLTLAYVCSRSRHEKYYCAMNPRKRKLYHCSHCTKCFVNQTDMQQHKLTHQPDDARCVCDICGKVRSTRSGLYKHKMKEHSGMANRFSCHICQKTFFTKDKHDRHLTVHIDFRPFVCEFCGKTFKTKQAVTRHQRLVHNNKYPYRCDKCGHGVEKMQYLESHRCGHVRRLQTETGTSASQHDQSSQAAPPVTKQAMTSQATEQNLTSAHQMGKDAFQCVLSGAAPVISKQQITYLDLNQMAAQLNSEHYSPQQNTSQVHALPLSLSLAQYSHVNYAQLPEADRRLKSSMIADNITMTHINTNQVTGYNKMAAPVTLI